MGAGKQSDTSIAYAARPVCRAIARASHPGTSLPRFLVAAQHGPGSMPDRNIRERDNAGWSRDSPPKPPLDFFGATYDCHNGRELFQGHERRFWWVLRIA